MALLKDWYRGLLRFLPKSVQLQFEPKEHIKNFPTLAYYTKEEQKKLEKMLGSRIRNISHFEQALTHRSYLSVAKQSSIKAESNERLEFLGDSVISIVVSDYLFNFYPNLPEGELTKMRARLVNKHTLALVAQNIGLQRFLKISYATEKNFAQAGENIISDAFEALVAAIYFDLGIEKTITFLYKHLLPFAEFEYIMADSNYKSILMELVQKDEKKPPTYQVLMESGPDHDKFYTIAVLVDEVVIGTGTGKNKKDAEQAAAKNAIDAMKK